MNEKINLDIKNAMKSQDKFLMSTLRMLKSELILESRKPTLHELTDDEVIAVIKRQVKVRKASIEEYTKYDRMDLVEGLEQELKILNTYLPEELSEEKINETINEVLTNFDNPSMKDIGVIMKTLKEKLGASADMSKVNAIVREKLN